MQESVGGPSPRVKPSLATKRPQRTMAERAVAGGLICTSCGQTKALTSFRALRTGSFCSWCNDCQRRATRDWRNRNRDSINASRRAAYSPAAHPAIACQVCGRAFIAPTRQAAYCSPAHKRRAKRRRLAERRRAAA